jgi:hypothetical protein
MKHRIGLTVLLLMTMAGHIALAEQQEVRTCSFEIKARCASGDISVTLAGGRVTRLEVNVFWCGLKGRPGYRCEINSSRNDKQSTWSDEGGATLITNTEPFNPDQPDRVKVTVGQHVSIDFEEAQSLGRCGAGAELPRAIVIPAQKAACRVWLGSR